MTGDGALEPQGDARDNLRGYASMYVSDPEDVSDPYVSQFLVEDHHDLTPALVVVSDHNGLRDERHRIAEQLREAGVPANVYFQFNEDQLADDGAQASPRLDTRLLV